MEMTTTPMSNDEIVETLKTMVFGVYAFERFNAKERETLDKAWNLIDRYEQRLKANMVAMLEELKEQLREMHEDFFETEHFDEAYGVSNSIDIIQEKINALRGEK